jgi:hypothetical protein
LAADSPLGRLYSPFQQASNRNIETKETAMFALTQITRSTQQYVCMALSALIVSASLSMGAYAAESAAHADYQVTITQIQ